MRWRAVHLAMMGIAVMAALGTGAGSSTAQGQPSLALTPAEVGVAETAVVEGRIACPTGGCGGFSIAISFDRALLRIERAIVGPYLGSEVFEAENLVDNAAGTVRLRASATVPPPAGAEDLLFQLNVYGLVPGSAALTIDALEITGPLGEPLPASGAGTSVTVFETGKIPFFSPPDNGWEVAFVSQRDGNPEIYVVAADGSNMRRLTDHPALDGSPHWSPDGNRLAFFSTRDGNAEIYVMDADGSNVRRLTDHPAADSYPVWSPDGGRIAFISERDGNSDIYVMNADGSDVRRLTDDPATDVYPAWSPRGNEIAFVSLRGGTQEVFMMNADGSNQRAITSLFGANGWYPAWAPDGVRMSFTTERGGDADIYSMNARGENIRRLTAESGWLTTTDWSPDGAYLAFMGGMSGFADLYVMDVETGYLYRLTDDEADDDDPDWRAIGRRLPCEISTDRRDVLVRVGPGTNRGVFDYLPPNRDFTVIGQALDDEGAVWWQLDKAQLTESAAVNSLWVASADVDARGDCGAVVATEPPPIIYGGPEPTPGQPGWGPCGSCDTCGHPANECVTSPAGECLWDPATCAPSITDGGCYSLTVTVTGTGTYSIRQRPNCDGLWQPGSPVTIGASGQPTWSGNCTGLVPTGTIQYLTMTHSCTVNINFGPVGTPG